MHKGPRTSQTSSGSKIGETPNSRFRNTHKEFALSRVCQTQRRRMMFYCNHAYAPSHHCPEKSLRLEIMAEDEQLEGTRQISLTEQDDEDPNSQ